jgi:uridine phosphorylase
MFNHHRGLWGYTGAARDGDPLTIQSTGMGGPSAAIVIAELADLGARRLLRVGTCGVLVPGFELGELLVAGEALAADGTSRALGAGTSVRGTPELLGRVLAAAGTGARSETIVSTDLFYDGRAGEEQRWIAAGAVAVDMETAPLFALAGLRGLETASLLLVTDLLRGGRRRIDADALRSGEHRLGEVAIGALAG